MGHLPVRSSEILGFAVVAGVLVEILLVRWAKRYLRRVQNPLLRSAVKRLNAPLRAVTPLMLGEFAVFVLPVAPDVRSWLLHIVGILLVMALSWLIIRVTYVVEDVVLAHYQSQSSDNLKARRIYTQIQVFRRITGLGVVFLALGVILFSFAAVRAAGTGILASAGVIGIVAGVAARPVVTNVIAGMQIAISQPIRVDDVVVVEGHWGRIEEIALTYVVVRVWDLRRLVLPISYFIENPFENWTRSTSDILGWVHIEVDYTADVDEIRKEFERVCAESPNWDGNLTRLQVTHLGATTMQLRLLMSSVDSSLSWNLQCEVREKVIQYLQRNSPQSLPRLRLQDASPPPGGASSSMDGAGTVPPDEPMVAP